MTVRNCFLLIFISYIISIGICQPPGGGNQNEGTVYIGTVDILQGRNFAQVTIDYDNNRVELIYEATDNAWNAIGFGKQFMDGAYAIVMSYDDQEPIVFDVTLGDHTPGDQLSESNLNTESDLFNSTTIRRRITVTRPIESAEDEGYSFPDPPPQGSPDPIQLSIIAAQGPGYDFFIGPANRHSLVDREPSY